jgi:hypothetical protein
MKIKSTTRRPLLATLLVFATAAIGLQPLVFNLGATCTCNAKPITSDTSVSTSNSSCCSSSGEHQVQTGCCSAKPVTTKKCLCNPQASVCECGDGCGCSEANDSNTLLPAIPTNEKTEVVTSTLICAAPFVGYPRESEIKPDAYRNGVAEHAALSSQQTCVRLSRFTC